MSSKPTGGTAQTPRSRPPREAGSPMAWSQSTGCRNVPCAKPGRDCPQGSCCACSGQCPAGWQQWHGDSRQREGVRVSCSGREVPAQPPFLLEAPLLQVPGRRPQVQHSPPRLWVLLLFPSLLCSKQHWVCKCCDTSMHSPVCSAHPNSHVSPDSQGPNAEQTQEVRTCHVPPMTL